jgi:hypothetical protein
MKKESKTIVTLTASEGHMLTDGENYGRIVYLASGDDGEKWYEITEAEYEAKMAELEAQRPELI